MKKLKLIITITFVLKIIITNAQSAKKKEVWISKENAVIILKDNCDSRSVLSTIYDEEELKTQQLGDTLRFYKDYSVLGSDKIYRDHYDFYIKKKTKRKLFINPISKLAKNFFQNRNTLKFTKQEYNIDKSFNFEKILYKSGLCYGTCSVIDLEIDKNRHIKGYRKIFDNEKLSGSFEGQISKIQYDVLIQILKTSNIKTWYFPEKIVHDSPKTTLTIYSNGEKKEFESNLTPTISHQLINYLYSLGHISYFTQERK